MSDPVRDLAQAAQAYIEATGKDDERAAAQAFREAQESLPSVLTGSGRPAAETGVLLGEKWEAEQSAAAWVATSHPDSEFNDRQFEQRVQQRDFADAALYFASDPQEMAVRSLRIATPIPVPEGAAHLEHAMVDTGRYSLRVDSDAKIRVFDKATGDESLVGWDEAAVKGIAGVGHVYLPLEDGTHIGFFHTTVEISKGDEEVVFVMDGMGQDGPTTFVHEPAVTQRRGGS